MTLQDLGYSNELEEYRKEHNLDSFGIGRIIAAHKERYTVKTDTSEFDAEILGNLRFTAKNRNDLPVVGDWVSISEYDENKALIHAVFPRKSTLERKAVGKLGQTQIIATNIDFGLIVQSVDSNFSINRIERYLTLCNTSNVKPIIILNKIDLINKEEVKSLIVAVQERIKQVPVIAISNESLTGFEKLNELLEKAKTYCLLGSSGVGKSTLVNNLSGKKMMKTNTISPSTQKGQHVTSHRELFVLENGGIIIDNPGMREVGIADSGSGLEKTFEKITALADKCKFKDCTHTTEAECAIIEAVNNGTIDSDSYDNYLKMEKETAHFESTLFEKREKDKKFGKMIKSFKKSRKSNKF